GDTAGYGQVVPLLPHARSAPRHLWHTPIGAVAAPFAPVFMRMREVPEEYRQHRYLTAGESARFLDLRHASKEDRSTVSVVQQGIESTRSAAAIGKRLLYLILQHSELFLPEVTAVWEATEQRLLAAHPNVLATAEALLAGGKPDLAEE